MRSEDIIPSGRSAPRSRAALVMCLSDPNRDPRPRRAIHWLREAFELTVAAFAPPDEPVDCFVDLDDGSVSGLGNVFRYGLHAAALWASHRAGRPAASEWSAAMRDCAQLLDGKTFDVVVCFDLDLLPLAHAVKGSGALIFDAREFYPRQFEDRPVWKACFQPKAVHLCQKYLRLCDAVFTVSPGLRDGYRAAFGIEAEVLMGFPDYHDLEPRQVNPGKVRLIYHGNANRSRATHQMIELVKRLDDRFHMDFMVLPTGGRYVDALKRQAADCARIRFQPPQRFENIVPFINGYDIGVFYVPPANFNLLHCLPNKFFEFIQARLAVAIGPSPDMVRILAAEGIGVHSEAWDLDELASRLNRLSADQIFELKRRSDALARRFSSGSSKSLFMATVNRLIESRQAVRSIV